MLCPYCKTQIPDGTQFCPKCGQTITNQEARSTASSSYWSTVEKEVARDDKIRIDAENELIKKQNRKLLHLQFQGQLAKR